MIKYDWSRLDEELINSYKIDMCAVRKFAVKHNMPIRRVYKRLEKLGIKRRDRTKIRGENHPLWKGGKYISKNGYVIVNVEGKKIGEHVLVMEKYLGRKLKRNEVTHHIDESFEGRSNNTINNLKLMTKSQHRKHHNGKPFTVYFSKWHSKWRLLIRGDTSKGVKSAGMYETKEQALQAVKEMGVGK